MSEFDKIQVHKLTVCVIDADTETIESKLENMRYGSWHILRHETAEVDWDDDHPLNKNATFEAAFEAIFPTIPTMPIDVYDDNGNYTASYDPAALAGLVEAAEKASARPSKEGMIALRTALAKLKGVGDE